MKIGIFTNNYLPNPYGVPNSIESFRKEFEVLGHQVFIFAPEWKGYRDENPNVFRYPAINLGYKIKFPLAIPYSKKIDKILEDLDIDIIHSQHPNLLGNAALKWARKKNIPLVFTWHTLYDRYTNFIPLIPNKLSAGWIIKKAVNYANKANLVIAPTDSVIEIIKDWGVRNEIIAIPTGIEEKDFQNPERKLLRDKYGLEDDEILLVLVSRLTEEKNIEFVFEALADLLKKEAGVKFLVAGNGYLVPKLKKFVADEKIAGQIIFSGIAERRGLKNYYAAGDIFVYASKSETQGMVLSEAMYMGLPIVAVNAPGASSLVINNQTGILTREDKIEFSGAVQKLIKDQELRLKFSEEAKKIAREKYTSKVCAKQMLEAYIQAIKSKGQNPNFK
jgi:1,2-diacylglycerol 3-alpha-glucosyltransferase